MVLALFSRLFGFFVLSPLFAQRGVPVYIRIGCALLSSFLLAPPLSTYLEWHLPTSSLWLPHACQEAILGYALGFLFSLLIEAATFAGQIVGSLTGLSFSEILDPLTKNQHPLIARLFSLTLFALFFAFDLHHLLLRLLYESFSFIPLTSASFISDAGSDFFHFTLSYALFPLVMLLILLIAFSLLSRFLPNLHIFFTGIPLQLLFGFVVLAIAVGFFGDILEQGFTKLLTSYIRKN